MNEKDYIRKQIDKKIDYSTPYYGRNYDIFYSKTDRDCFPYTRVYRGRYNVDTPIIVNNRPGYRYIPKHVESFSDSYIPSTLPPFKDPPHYSEYKKPSFCWQVPCSTTLPCYRNISNPKG
jgi:hypothetical protein